jgi:hypothetical protein
MEHGKGLDGFLSATSKSPKSGGAFLGSWKKNIDEDHGEITVWLPTKCMPFSFWAHPMQAVIESQDKLKVVPRMFGCHEAGIMKQIRKDQVVSASLQRWRLDNGEAEHKPELCPECILTDAISKSRPAARPLSKASIAAARAFDTGGSAAFGGAAAPESPSALREALST